MSHQRASFLALMLCVAGTPAHAQYWNYPPAGPLTGNERVGPVLQGVGQDRTTTTSAIVNQTPLTIGSVSRTLAAWLATKLDTTGDLSAAHVNLGATSPTLAAILANGAPVPQMAIGDPSVHNWGLFGTPGSPGGPGLLVSTPGTRNAIIGMVDVNVPNTFPAGVTGYGQSRYPGGTAFGLFGRADLYAPGSAVNEINSFNYSGLPSTLLPPSLGFGTSENNAITLQLVPYGNNDSSLGLQLVPGYHDDGLTPTRYRTAQYFWPGLFTQYGLFIDANASDTATAMVIKRGGGGQHLNLLSVGSYSPTSAVFTYTDTSGVVRSSIRQNGDTYLHDAILSGHINGASGASVTATTGTLAAGSTDLRGSVTLPAGTTSVSITFSPGYTSAPFAVVSGSAAVGTAYVQSITTSGLTIGLSANASGNTVTWMAMQ